MNIEKCVVYIVSQNPMARINSAVVEGQKRVPVSLPRLKCLEGEDEKYLPYEDSDVALLKKEKSINIENGLTVREKKAYDLFKSGIQVKYIAREFRDSNNRVRAMIQKAKLKLGVDDEA